MGEKGDEVSWSVVNPRETAAGGEVELPVLHGAASSQGKKNQCSKYQVGPHPPRRASHNKSHPWVELLSMMRSR